MEKAVIFLAMQEQEEMASVAETLTNAGYTTSVFSSGTDLLCQLKFTLPDFLLMDISLPDHMSGIDLCRMIRDNPETRCLPVFLFNNAYDEINEVLSYEMGADAYIVRPVSPRTLLARIKSLLRRISFYQDLSEKDSVLRVRDLTIDPARRVASKKGKTLRLTYKEFELLYVLVRHAGQVLTRGSLLDTVWGYDYFGETRTVDVHIRSLRKALSGDGNSYIETVRGIGYKFIS
ncbi:MAG TPA: response regulator transcription factor [Firmicutes bacterium]|nr:response regulator transcription factor [Bacillota bacterium]